MAKIKCSIDTKEKSIEVSVDGEVIENFGYLSVYGANSPYGYMFNMASIEEMEDCNKTTYWSHSNEAKQFVNDVQEFLRHKSIGTLDKDADEMPTKKGKKKKKEGQDDEDMDEMMNTKEKKKCS